METIKKNLMFIFCSSPKCTLHTTLTDDVVLIKDILEVTPKKDLKTQKAKKEIFFFFTKYFLEMFFIG